MALHHELPIYKAGADLLALAYRAQEQMPRGMKRTLGERINQHCLEMIDAMAMANATKQAERAAHIETLLKHLRTTQILLRVGHEGRHVSHALWAQSIELLDSIGRQGGGWLKSSHQRKAPAA